MNPIPRPTCTVALALPILFVLATRLGDAAIAETLTRISRRSPRNSRPRSRWTGTSCRSPGRSGASSTGG